jgi:Putative zinc-finger
MTHDEAKKSMAAEAYVLDDLEPAERSAFEEHFFDCTACTSDVLDAASVADGVRTETTNVVPFRYYPQWAAAAAAVAVAVGLAHHYWPQPPPGPTTALIRNVAVEQTIDLDAARAVQTPYLIVRNQSVSVGFAIPVMEPHPPYVCELRDDKGLFLGRKTVTTKDEAANAVSLVIPAGKFHNGNYTLGIRGGDREIPPYHFAVEVQ